MGRGAPRHVPQCSRRSPFYRYGTGGSTSPYRAVVSRSSPVRCRVAALGPVRGDAPRPGSRPSAFFSLLRRGIVSTPHFWNCRNSDFLELRNSILPELPQFHPLRGDDRGAACRRPAFCPASEAPDDAPPDPVLPIAP